MAELPSVGDGDPKKLEQWRHILNPLLPAEREILGQAIDASFSIADARTIIFRFPPVSHAIAHDVEWSSEPDFTNSRGAHVRSGANQIEVTLPDSFTCASKWYFRFRGDRNGTKTPWSPTKTFTTPVPGALAEMTAAHTVDNVTEENPIINVNIVLPTTATVGGGTISDHEALWTDHVDLEAPWSALNGAISDSDTVLTVTTGEALYFKVGGFYKIEDEIVGVNSVDDPSHQITVNRAQLETTAAAHADTTVISFYSRVLREMFTGSQSGRFGVIVTIPNPEKVRLREFDAWPVSKCNIRGPLTEASALLNTPDLIIDLVAEPFFQKVVLRWSEDIWPAYRYEIYHSTAVPIPIADLDPTLTGGVELLARPLADHAGEATFVHDLDFIVGVVHYYGVRAVDIFGGFRTPGGGDTVGPLQSDRKTVNASPDVENITATEGPVHDPSSVLPTRSRSSSKTRSSVTAGFDPPSVDPDSLFKLCRLYMQPTGVRATLLAAINNAQTVFDIPLADAVKLSLWRDYTIDSERILVTGVTYPNATDPTPAATLTVLRGQFGTSAVSHLINANVLPAIVPQLMAEGPTAPLQFVYPSIGEVTLYYVSVNFVDTENEVLSSPNLTVTLDGQTSAPLEVQNLRGLKTERGGKIFWSEGFEPDLALYQIADLGSRTLVNQADILDRHIIAEVTANPQAGRKAQWEWVEVEYEGEIALGSSSVVLGRTAASLAELVEDRFDPLGGGAVKETLQFSRSSVPADLTGTDYNINSNDEDTIILSSAPAEAASSAAIVRFHIGGRAHKIYVRAVNDSGLASEWRPVEATFLELAVLAPDGSNDLGPPAAFANPSLQFFSSTFTVGKGIIGSTPGMVTVRPAAASIQESEQTEVEDALTRNIGGISSWEFEVTHSDDGVTSLVASTFEFRTAANKANFVNQNLSPEPDNRWFWLAGSFEIQLPNQGVTGVRVRAKNWFGWGDWISASGVSMTSGSPQFTGPLKNANLIEESISAGSIYPNLAESDNFKVALTANITVQDPEYRGGSDAKGAGGNGNPNVGDIFTMIVEQPASGTPRTVAFSANYKGLDGKEVDMRFNRYSAWTFLVESTTYFRCISFLTGNK